MERPSTVVDTTCCILCNQVNTEELHEQQITAEHRSCTALLTHTHRQTDRQTDRQLSTANALSVLLVTHASDRQTKRGTSAVWLAGRRAAGARMHRLVNKHIAVDAEHAATLLTLVTLTHHTDTLQPDHLAFSLKMTRFWHLTFACHISTCKQIQIMCKLLRRTAAFNV